MQFQEANNNLDKLQENLGYKFLNSTILVTALTHTTFAYEAETAELSDNQRLEFLGDSILGMIVAEYLFFDNPHFSEGKMTQKRALLVNKGTLALRARELDLSPYLLLGKGEEKMNGRNNDKNLACALEAIIGGIYLDGGLEQVKEFIKLKIIK